MSTLCPVFPSRQRLFWLRVSWGCLGSSRPSILLGAREPPWRRRRYITPRRQPARDHSPILQSTPRGRCANHTAGVSRSLPRHRREALRLSSARVRPSLPRRAAASGAGKSAPQRRAAPCPIQCEWRQPLLLTPWRVAETLLPRGSLNFCPPHHQTTLPFRVCEHGYCDWRNCIERPLRAPSGRCRGTNATL